MFKKLFTRFIIKKLFRVIAAEDLLIQKSDGTFIYRGRELSKEDSRKLIEDAKAFSKGILFEMLLNEMDYLAIKKISFESRNTQDVADNQMLLYFNSIFRKKVINISNSQLK